MNEYQDKWTRYHDKPCVNGTPKSNNGWIYTAYAKKLGLPLGENLLSECFQLCRKDYSPLGMAFDRSPGKEEPPASRDEVLGLFMLGLLSAKQMDRAGWNFSPYPVPRFNLFKTIAAFWRLKSADRNAVWENGGEPHAWRFAFSLPINDRAYILRASGLRVPFHYWLFEKISQKLPSDSNSSKLIEWAKYGDKPDPKVFLEYFGKDHPFIGHIR